MSVSTLNVSQPTQYSVPVSLDRICCFFDGLQATMGCPKIPLFQKGFRCLYSLLEKLLEVETDVVGTTGFQIEFFDLQSFKGFELRRLQVVLIF